MSKLSMINLVTSPAPRPSSIIEEAVRKEIATQLDKNNGMFNELTTIVADLRNRMDAMEKIDAKNRIDSIERLDLRNRVDALDADVNAIADVLHRAQKM